MFVMTVVVPAVNGEDIAEHSGKIYRNVFVFGIGHNQKEVDATYKQPNEKWIIQGVEFDLVIAPYTGRKAEDFGLAAIEHFETPVVSDKAFEPYKGALFENVICHSGGGPALRNQRELGNIKTIPEHVTFLGDPATFSPGFYKKPGDTYVANPADPITLTDLSLSFGILNWPGSVQIGSGWGHSLKSYPLNGYVPDEFVVGGVDKGLGTGQSLDECLGGIDFTSLQLNYISTYTYSNPTAQMQNFDFVLKAKKAEKNDKIIDFEDAAELSLNAFFIGLILMESKFWVNLNPWEPDRIIEKDLEETDVGRIMLEADLQMKKDFCKYKNPCESEIGEEYWRLLDEKGEELINECMNNHLGEIEDINNVQFAPVTRHWIVPDRVEAYETDNEIYIVNATLNIYSEPVYEHSTYEIVNQDAFFVSRACKDDLSEAAKEYGRYAKELEEKMILALVVHEVNHGENYSDLRCVYNSLALAQWYKDKYRYSPSIFTDFIDSKDLAGLESKSTWSAENIWSDYVKSFEEGEFHCWKNETYQEGDYIITSTKHYSSGGVDFGDIETSIVGDMPSDLRDLTSEAVYSVFAKEGNDYYFGDGLYVFYEGLEKATFEIRKLIISPAMVKVGKPVTIKVVVKNAGEMEDTKTINIEIDDEITGSKEVTLAPDEIITLEFTQIQSAEGDHSVTVDGLTGNYKVVTPGFEVISTVIGLLSVVYLINLKKRKRRK